MWINFCNLMINHQQWVRSCFLFPGVSPLGMMRLETLPAGPSGRDITQWLHHHFLLAGQKTMWSTITAWELPVTLPEVQEICETCVVYLKEHLWRPVGTTRQVVWGWVLLTLWQVDEIRPLVSSEGYKYAIIFVICTHVQWTWLLDFELLTHMPPRSESGNSCASAFMCYLWVILDHWKRSGDTFYWGLGTTMGPRPADWLEVPCGLSPQSCQNDWTVLWPLKTRPVSHDCHPYAGGRRSLDKMLMDCPPDSKWEELEEGPSSSGSLTPPNCCCNSAAGTD